MWKNIIWKILALIILISLPYAISRLGRAEADYSMAPMSVEITITVTPITPGTSLAPQNFMAIYVTDNVVLLTWDGLPTGATSVMILAKDSGYSDNVDDGYYLYEGVGDNVSDTSVNFNEYFGYKYYTAYSYNGTDWSPFYSQAKVVSPNVTEITNALTRFNTIINNAQIILSENFASAIILIIILALTGLAFWHRDRLLYIIAGIAFVLSGFDYWSISHYLSILVVLAGMYMFFKAKYDKRTG